MSFPRRGFGSCFLPGYRKKETRPQGVWIIPLTCNRGQPKVSGPIASDEHNAVVASLGGITALLKGFPRREQIPLLRKYMDTMFGSDESGAQITPIAAAGALVFKSTYALEAPFLSNFNNVAL